MINLVYCSHIYLVFQTKRGHPSSFGATFPVGELVVEQVRDQDCKNPSTPITRMKIFTKKLFHCEVLRKLGVMGLFGKIQ